MGNFPISRDPNLSRPPESQGQMSAKKEKPMLEKNQPLE